MVEFSNLPNLRNVDEFDLNNQQTINFYVYHQLSP